MVVCPNCRHAAQYWVRKDCWRGTVRKVIVHTDGSLVSSHCFFDGCLCVLTHVSERFFEPNFNDFSDLWKEG